MFSMSWMLSLALAFCAANAVSAAEPLKKADSERRKLTERRLMLEAEVAKLRALLVDMQQKETAESKTVAKRLQVRIEQLKAQMAAVAVEQVRLQAHAEATRDPFAVGKGDEPWKNELMQKLEKKVSFEFVETPFSEAIAFLRQLSNVNIVVDPAVRQETPELSLRVTDMSMASALRLMCRVAGTKYELQDHAIYVSFEEKAQRVRPESKIPATAKLRVRLADGSELEADGSIFAARPDLLERVINRFLDDDGEQGNEQANYEIQGTLEPGKQAGTYKVRLSIQDISNPDDPQRLAAPIIVVAQDKPGEIRVGNGNDEIICRVHVGAGNVVAGQATVRVVKNGKQVARRDIVMPLVKPGPGKAAKPPAPPAGKNQF
jgi:hypothetical protein